MIPLNYPFVSTRWSVRLSEPHCEECEACLGSGVGAFADMIEVLHRCALHLQQEAEAEHDGERWQANDAMILCSDIDDLLAAHPFASGVVGEDANDVS